MNADDMEKMAEFHLHMAEKFAIRHRDSDGLLAVVWQMISESHRESALWWREQRGKADLR